jgi:hypothetical protein
MVYSESPSVTIRDGFFDLSGVRSLTGITGLPPQALSKEAIARAVVNLDNFMIWSAQQDK